MTQTKHEILYNGQKLQIQGVENCSVSEFIAESKTFYESRFLSSLEKLVEPGEWALDIGAHIGNHSIFFSEVMGLRVMAFEANPDTFKVLKQNIEVNEATARISAQNLAVCEKEGTVTLWPIEDGDAGTYSIVREDTESAIRCRSTHIDAFFDYFETRRPTLIKIDVEGAESLVLDGALRTIEMFKPILAIEIMTVAALKAVSDRLVPLGYIPEQIHNATPTIIWAQSTACEGIKEKALDRAMNILTYAVSASQSAQAFRAIVMKNRALSEAETTNVKKTAQPENVTEVAEPKKASKVMQSKRVSITSDGKSKDLEGR